MSLLCWVSMVAVLNVGRLSRLEPCSMCLSMWMRGTTTFVLDICTGRHCEWAPMHEKVYQKVDCSL